MIKTCYTCAHKRDCEPLNNLIPLHKSLALAATNAFPPPCGGALYEQQRTKNNRMRAFEQYKKPVAEEDAKPLPHVRTLDDLDGWGGKKG